MDTHLGFRGESLYRAKTGIVVITQETWGYYRRSDLFLIFCEIVSYLVKMLNAMIKSIYFQCME